MRSGSIISEKVVMPPPVLDIREAIMLPCWFRLLLGWICARLSTASIV